MKKSILFPIILVAFCSCATKPLLIDTVWQTEEKVSNKIETGTKISSIHFQKDGRVDVYNAIATDSAFSIAPYKYARGTYQINGRLKKKSIVKLDLLTIERDSIQYSGLIDNRKKAMLLANPNGTAVFYVKNFNLFIK